MNGPTTEKQRYVVLDALRGLALLGIALANFPEFGLWTFLSSEAQEAMPTANADHVTRFLQYLFVDGKFYTIFSILFGIGFSITLSRRGVGLFYRRMSILLLIGFLHLMFIWSGDILLLYAVGGMLLPLFTRLSNRSLLTVALLLILLPVALETYAAWRGFDFAAPLYEAWWRQANSSGITEENFASWLRDAKDYGGMFEFLKQCSIERMWEFVGGHRLPKVLGLFLIGYYIGRNRLYARLDEQRPLMKKGVRLMLPWALPTSALYAWSAMSGHPWGQIVHSVLYAVSVVPMGLVYILLVCLWLKPFEWLKSAGRMALTCYITQSLIGILLFYGIGFGMGTSCGLITIEGIATLVFLLEVVLCRLWLSYFRFGPLEWIWRLLTYGEWIRLRK